MLKFIKSFLTETIDKFKDPKVLSITFLISFIILFLPPKYIKILKLEKFINEFNYIFGLLLVISGSGLLVLIGFKIYNKIQIQIFYFKRKRYLKTLSPAEKLYLSFYINKNKKTYKFSINNGVINKLVDSKILYINSAAFSYSMRDFVWEYLNKNKKLIELSEEEIKLLKKEGIYKK